MIRSVVASSSRLVLRNLTRSNGKKKNLHPRVRWHGGGSVADDAPTVNVTFVEPDGETKKQVQARVGETLLQTAHRNDIDLEGACEGKQEIIIP